MTELHDIEQRRWFAWHQMRSVEIALHDAYNHLDYITDPDVRAGVAAAEVQRAVANLVVNGIRHTPAVVTEAGSNLKISEFPLPPPAAAPAPALSGGGKVS